jgi:hypothetical protein
MMRFSYRVRGEEFFPHIFVMGRRVVLGPIVGVVRWARSPEEIELILCNGAVAEPVETHVHCLRIAVYS